jgi:drug/metabolite transporter (DMT)-like permease
LNKTNYKAHLALLGANVIYGINHIVAKGIMPYKIGPSAFVFLRIVGAGLLFWMIKWFIKEKISKKDYPLLILCGLLGVAANQLFFFNGLSLTSPIDASIIITAVPVLVLVFSAFILKEKITAIKLIGIALGGIGAVLLILYGKKAGGTSSVLGNLFVFINASTYALYFVLVKPLMKKYNPITIVSWVFLFGFIFMFPFGIKGILNTDFTAFTLSTYLTVAYVVLGTTFLTYLLNIYALTKVAPSVNGSYIYLQPVVSFIMVTFYAYVLKYDQYSQDISYVKILSCLMVIAGVYLISKKSKISLI